MNLGAASRHLVGGGMGWSLRTSAESLRRVYRGRGASIDDGESRICDHKTVLRSSAKWRDDTVSLRRGKR
jgi:hypothetical protein